MSKVSEPSPNMVSSTMEDDEGLENGPLVGYLTFTYEARFP